MKPDLSSAKCCPLVFGSFSLLGPVCLICVALKPAHRMRSENAVIIKDNKVIRGKVLKTAVVVNVNSRGLTSDTFSLSICPCVCYSP